MQHACVRACLQVCVCVSVCACDCKHLCIIYTCYTKWLDKLRKWVPGTQKRKEISYSHISAKSLEVQSPCLPDLNPLYFCLRGDLNSPQSKQVQLKMKRHFTSTPLCLSPFAAAPAQLKKCENTGSNVSPRAPIQVGDILSLFCEFCFDKQWQINRY
jgi:hypothetical protein